jgi:hypothetical protein
MRIPVQKPLFYLMILLLVVGCHQNNDFQSDHMEPEEETVVMSPNTKIVPLPTSSMITEIDSERIVFSGSNRFLDDIEVGDIIVSDRTPEAEFGFCRRVTGGERSSQRLTLETVPAGLDEALLDAEIDFHTQLTGSNKTQKTTGFYWDIAALIFDGDNDSTSLDDNLSIDGNLDLTIDLHLQMSIKRRYFKLELSTEGQMNTEITAGGPLGQIGDGIWDIVFNSGTVGYEVTVIQIPQPLIVIQLGAFPLVVRPVINVVVGATGNIQAIMKVTNVFDFEASGYVEYDFDGWHRGGDGHINTYSEFEGAQKTTLRGYMGPELQFWLYGRPQFAATAGVYGFLEYKYDSDFLNGWSWELNAGVQAVAKVEVSIFNWFNLMYSKTLYETVTPLAASSGSLCFGFRATANVSGGTATLVAEGGETPYEYALDSGPFGPNTVYSNLPSGRHDFMVRDGWGCTSNGFVIVP